ncbi:MAG: MBL fold metallo-hydrolase, partial [Pseudomonadota bacterium]
MPTINRRLFLASGLAAPALITHRALALPTAPDATQNGGWYKFHLGSFEITVVSDGNLVTPTEILGVDQPREAVTEYLTRHYMDPVSNYAHTNH